MGTNFNYDDTSHQVIFDHINGGAGSDALQESSRVWQQLGDGVGTTCKSFVQSAIDVMLAARQGAAADAAVAATGAMLPWMDTLQQTAAAVAQQTQGQAEHWVNAKNSVPPVPATPKPAPFASDPGEWAAEKMDWFPGITSDEEKAQLHQQDAAEQARQAMRVYQSNSNDNIGSTPAFTEPQALDASVGSLPLTKPQVDAAGSATPIIAIAGGGVPAHVRPAYRPTTQQPVTLPPAHQGTTAQPAPTVSQLAQTPPAAIAGNLGPPSNQGALGEGMTPSGLPISTELGESTTRAARSVPAPGSERGGGGHTGFGPRPTPAFGPRPTTSARPAVDEMSTSRGIAGPAAATRNTGESGYGQPFGGGAPNQQGERDREHRSKYLIHEDSNAIVGELPPTAPPVIGADY